MTNSLYSDDKEFENNESFEEDQDFDANYEDYYDEGEGESEPDDGEYDEYGNMVTHNESHGWFSDHEETKKQKNTTRQHQQTQEIINERNINTE